MTITIQADDVTEDRQYDVSLSDEDIGSHVTVRLRPVQRKHEEDSEFEENARSVEFDVGIDDLASAVGTMRDRLLQREIREKGMV